MKSAFQPDVLVRFRTQSGGLAKIHSLTRQEFWDASIGLDGSVQTHYLGEGFYSVRTMDNRNIIAHEDDLVLAE